MSSLIRNDNDLKFKLDTVFPIFDIKVYILMILMSFNFFGIALVLSKFNLPALSNTLLILLCVLFVYTGIIIYSRFSFRETIYRVEDKIMYCVDPNLNVIERAHVRHLNNSLDSNLCAFIRSKYSNMSISVIPDKIKSFYYYIDPFIVVYFRTARTSFLYKIILRVRNLIIGLSSKRVVYVDSYASKNYLLGYVVHHVAHAILSLIKPELNEDDHHELMHKSGVNNVCDTDR